MTGRYLAFKYPTSNPFSDSWDDRFLGAFNSIGEAKAKVDVETSSSGGEVAEIVSTETWEVVLDGTSITERSDEGAAWPWRHAGWEWTSPREPDQFDKRQKV